MDTNVFWKRPVAALILIVAVGVAAYSNTFHVPFTFDDKWTLIDNQDVRNPGDYFANSVAIGNFPNRFVTYLSFALNFHFGGFNVTGYHVVNLIIHLTAAVLVYALLRLTFRTPYFTHQGGTGFRSLRSQVQREADKAAAVAQPEVSTESETAFNYASLLLPLFAALLFVAHPVQTQAVTYIIQRTASLATMFYLLSVVLYVLARLRMERPAGLTLQNSEPESASASASASKSASASASKSASASASKSASKSASAPASKPASPRVLLLFAGSVLAALLAMKSKEIAVTLPLAVILFEVCFFNGPWRRRLFCLMPLLATLPIVPVSVFMTGDSAGDVLSDIGEKSRAFTDLSRWDYLFTQFRVIVTYLRLLVFPIDQNVDYDYPLYTTFLTPPVFLSFLLLAALVAVAFYLLRVTRVKGEAGSAEPESAAQPESLTAPASVAKPAFFSASPLPHLRLIAFGLLWFFLTLSVESSIVPIPDVIFEHRLYLPFFGAATAFAAVLLLLARRFLRQAAGRGFITVSALVVAALAIATFQRNQVWGSELSLWQDAALKSPQKGRVLNNFGVALEGAGRRADAARVLSRAIEADPDYFKSYYNLADLYLVSDQPRESLPLLRTAIRIKPDFTLAYVKMGAALLRGRQYRETVAFLEQNLDRVGDNGEARFYLGAAHAFLGNRDAAQRELAVVARLDARLAATLAGLLGRNSPHGVSNGRN